jgi:hypothetical protein
MISQTTHEAKNNTGSRDVAGCIVPVVVVAFCDSIGPVCFNVVWLLARVLSLRALFRATLVEECHSLAFLA